MANGERAEFSTPNMKGKQQRYVAKSGRSFQVCEFCGGWWETTEEKNSAPINYIFLFFYEEHTRCARPTDSRDVEVSLKAVWDSDPEFKLLDPAKEWKPEQCPAYRPPVKPSEKLCGPVREKDLLGWWITLNDRGGLPECWRFDERGRGFIGAFSIAYCEFTFVWQLGFSNQIQLRLVSPDPDPPLDFFFSGDALVTMQDRTDAYGKESRVLTIKDADGGAVELIKQAHDPWREWKDAQE